MQDDDSLMYNNMRSVESINIENYLKNKHE